MMISTAMRMIEKVEQEFMPDDYRIITKLSKEHLFCYRLPDPRIWRRGDGGRYREMYTLEVFEGASRFGTASELIMEVWNGLVNNIDGIPIMFSGPFGFSEWRRGFKTRDVVWVRNCSCLAFGSAGILKNCVWRWQKIPEDKQKWWGMQIG